MLLHKSFPTDWVFCSPGVTPSSAVTSSGTSGCSPPLGFLICRLGGVCSYNGICVTISVSGPTKYLSGNEITCEVSAHCLAHREQPVNVTIHLVAKAPAPPDGHPPHSHGEKVASVSRPWVGDGSVELWLRHRSSSLPPGPVPVDANRIIEIISR